MANQSHLKIHWTHKMRIKKLYKEGYVEEELAQMYKVPIWYVKGVTRALRKPERI